MSGGCVPGSAESGLHTLVTLFVGGESSWTRVATAFAKTTAGQSEPSQSQSRKEPERGESHCLRSALAEHQLVMNSHLHVNGLGSGDGQLHGDGRGKLQGLPWPTKIVLFASGRLGLRT